MQHAQLNGTAPAPAGREIRLFDRPFWTDDIDSLNLAGGSGFETLELALIARSVGPGSVCVDIGANIGVFTVALARAAGPGGRVYAFEPDPYNFALLRRNAAVWRDACDLRLFRSACADANGVATLHASVENRGMHRLYASVCCAGADEQVRAVVADDIVAEPVDFIKIDVEGYEPFALRGLAATLARSANVRLLTEFSPLSMLEAGSSATAYLALLERFDLRPFRISAHGLEPIDASRLKAECARLEQGDFAGLLSSCAGLGAAQIFEAASRYAAGRGYAGPIVENLLFARADLNADGARAA